MYLQLFSCGYEEYPECGKWELLFPVAFNAARTSLSILRLTAVFFYRNLINIVSFWMPSYQGLNCFNCSSVCSGQSSVAIGRAFAMIFLSFSVSGFFNKSSNVIVFILIKSIYILRFYYLLFLLAIII